MGAVQTARIFPDKIEDGSWEINALVARVTRTFHGTFPSYTKYDDKLLWYPELVPAIPKIGQAHPSRKDTFVRALSSTGLSNNDFKILAHYEGIGQPGYVSDRDSIQMQVIRNFDIYGNVTLVPYKPTPGDNTSTQLVKPRHIANLQKIIDLPCIRFTVYCLTDARKIYLKLKNTVNMSSFNGDPARTWLVLSMKSHTDNNRLHRVDGVLCYKKETWDGVGLYLDANGNKVEGMTPFPTPDEWATSTQGLVTGKGMDPGATPNGWRRWKQYQETNFDPFNKFTGVFS